MGNYNMLLKILLCKKHVKNVLKYYECQMYKQEQIILTLY